MQTAQTQEVSTQKLLTGTLEIMVYKLYNMQCSDIGLQGKVQISLCLSLFFKNVLANSWFKADISMLFLNCEPHIEVHAMLSRRPVKHWSRCIYLRI